MESVPESVWNVKASEVVAEDEGASVIDGVVEPEVRVTTLVPGDTGLPNTSTPSPQLPDESREKIVK
jgi:hypothetical protein